MMPVDEEIAMPKIYKFNRKSNEAQREANYFER